LIPALPPLRVICAPSRRNWACWAKAPAGARRRALRQRAIETVWPILNEIGDSFRRGQRVAVDEAASFGNEALTRGAKLGGDALSQIADQARRRPLVTLAVAIGIGVLIGAVARRN
jgi:hypothetical protein